MELPAGWRLVKLQQVADLINGDRGKNYPSRDALVQSGIPFINAGHLTDDGTVDLSTMNYITEDRFRLLGSGKVEAHDILYCLRGSLGKAAIVRGFDRGAIASSLVIVRPGPAALPEYVYAFLVSPAGKELIEAYDNGTAQPNLAAGSVGQYAFPLAPVGEQRRIVAKLESLQSRSRRAREALDAVPPLLEKLRQSILAAAFRGDLTKDWRAQNPTPEPAEALLARIRAERRKKWEETELAKLKAKGKPPTNEAWKTKYKDPEPVDTTGLPELPDGWCWATVEQLAHESTYGTSAKSFDLENGVPVLGMGNIRDGELVYTKLKKLPKDHEEFPALLLRDGDILFNRTNSAELVGKTAVFRGSAVHSFASYLIRIRSSFIEPQLLSFFINSPFGRRWVASVVSQQVGQANVNGSKLASLAVPIPATPERGVLLPRIESALQLINGFRRTSNGWKELFAELERSLLGKAFRGQLVPQDASDESADVMLARLKAATTVEASSNRARRGKAAE